MLATSFVQLGKKVLLIDADLRNSRLQDLLPHGHTPPNPVELLASGRFREILTRRAQPTISS